MHTHIMGYLEDVHSKVNCDLKLFVLFYLKITFQKKYSHFHLKIFKKCEDRKMYIQNQ